jgi:CheY-like chemotaxis protein
LLSDLLSLQGYDVRPVPNGRQAISSAQFTVPDLILLDILMPDIDGYAVCQALKADERTRDVPIIFISGFRGKKHPCHQEET